MKVTLDTNVLVRLATQDDPAQAALALKVLQKAELIAVPTPALCEMVWVLLRGYRYTPAQVAHALRALMQVSQVVCHTPPMAMSNSPTCGHPKFPQAGRSDYDVSGLMAMRAAASFSR